MTVFDGAFTGFTIGIVLSLPATAAELLRHREDLPLVVDLRSVWGRQVPPAEVLSWSTAFFLVVATLYGAAYPTLVSLGLVGSYAPLPIAAYTLAFFLAIGLGLAPALGLGLFARREGRIAWLELLMSSALIGIAYWYAANHLILG